VTEGFIDHR